jgi:hypothetical protein
MKKKRNQSTIKPKQKFKLPLSLRQRKIEPSLIDIKYFILNFQDHEKHTPHKKERIPFVRLGKHLPEPYKQSWFSYTSNEVLIDRGCYYNASQLSLLDNRIKLVHGYYGTKMSPKTRDMFEKIVKQYRIKSNLDGFYEIPTPFGRTFIDFKNNQSLNPHSWNYIDGVHFDVTREFDESLQSDWVNYYPIRYIDTSEFSHDETSELTSRIRKTKIQLHIENKLSILNIAA